VSVTKLPEVTVVTAPDTPGNVATVKNTTSTDAAMHDHRRDD
jgi:hypothetical protein